MLWFRIDNRLIHGQIIEAWLPHTGATHLVVCNENVANDMLRQQIMLLAVPSHIRVDFVSPSGLDALLRNDMENNTKTIILMADCADARAVYQSGVRFTLLNIGNMHYLPGKRQICAHVALSDQDAACLRNFVDHNVTLDFRCVPNDRVDIPEW